MDNFPGTSLAHEDIRGDQVTVVYMFVADDVGAITAMKKSYIGTSDLNIVAVFKDVSPTLHNLLMPSQR